MTFPAPGRLELSPEDREFFKNHIWFFRFPFEGSNSRCKIDPAAEIENLLLKEIDFKDKSVLNIGCREGFFAFYAEANGASRVLAIDGQPKEFSSEKAFEILKRGLNSKCEYRNLSGDEIASLFEEFDIILLSDCLAYARDSEVLLSTVRRIGKKEVWVFSYFLLDNTDTPISVTLRDYSPKPNHSAKRAFNLSWLLNSMDAASISVNKAKLHSNLKYVTLIGAPKPRLEDLKPLSYSEMSLDDKRIEQTAILVMSCKKFEQLWDPFFILFKRYWPDCPYKVYFCTDTGSYPGVETIEIGEDRGWAGNCKAALKIIQSQRFILLQEDFLFTSTVDTERVRKFAEHAHQFDVGCLRLSPVPGATGKWFGASSLGVIQPLDDYRLSMQIAIWKKDLFDALLIEGESPWQVEIEGSKRAAIRSEIFLSTWEKDPCPIPYFITAVEKGEWKDEALALLDKENIPRAHISKKVY